LALDPAEGGDPVFVNLLLAPAWGFQATGAAVSALTGLGYDFASPLKGAEAAIEAALAVVAITALILLVHRRGPSRMLSALLVLAALLWVMQALVWTPGGDSRAPDASRYLYPGAVVVVLLLAEAARRLKWSSLAVGVLGFLAVAGIGTNVVLMADYGNFYRAQADRYRDLALVSEQVIAARYAAADLNGQSLPTAPADPQDVVADTATLLLGMIDLPYGRFATDPARVPELPEARRAALDTAIATNLGLALQSPQGSPVACRTTAAAADGSVTAPVPFGGALITSPVPADLSVGLNASSAGVPVGSVQAGQAVQLTIPGPGAFQNRWFVQAAAPSLEVCSVSDQPTR
jgi:hypothetical protein